jgi:CRP/FNR family cyclic AMP-dependent transcriptional regulator
MRYPGDAEGPFSCPDEEVNAMVLLDMLDDIDFLKGLAPEARGYLAAIGELREYPPGTVLFQEGKESCQVYLVSSGKVELEMRVPGVGAMPIQTVGPGELLGWSPVLQLGPMTATARALTRCRVVAFNVRRLLDRCEEMPPLGMEFLRRTSATMAQRLNATRLRLLNLLSVSCAASNGAA